MQAANRTNVRPAISKVEDVKSIMAYSHYLVMKAQLTGNLCYDGHKPTTEEKSVAEQCRRVCEKITRGLDICRIDEIPDLLEYYDIAFRIGNKCLPDHTFISHYKRLVFNTWKAGDRRITESYVFGIIAPEVLYRPEHADREYVAAYRMIKDKWLTTLKRFDRFPDATSYENYHRLALMMRENIDAEFGTDAKDIKRRWYEHNKIEDFSKVSSTILRSYRRFASSLFPAIFDYETQLELDNRILSELSTRTDLNPYDREAFRLARKFGMELV